MWNFFKNCSVNDSGIHLIPGRVWSALRRKIQLNCVLQLLYFISYRRPRCRQELQYATACKIPASKQQWSLVLDRITLTSPLKMGPVRVYYYILESGLWLETD